MKTTLLVFAICTIFTALTWAQAADQGDITSGKQLVQQGYFTDLNEAIHTANILNPNEIETAKDLKNLGIVTEMSEAVSIAWRNDKTDIECAKRHMDKTKQINFYTALNGCVHGFND